MVMWLMLPRVKRFLTRSVLRAHDAEIRAVLATLTDAELLEAGAVLEELTEIVRRTHETRRGLEAAAQ